MGRKSEYCFQNIYQPFLTIVQLFKRLFQAETIHNIIYLSPFKLITAQRARKILNSYKGMPSCERERFGSKQQMDGSFRDLGCGACIASHKLHSGLLSRLRCQRCESIFLRALEIDRGPS